MSVDWFVPADHAYWRPGAAGYYERYLFGSGRIEGSSRHFFAYAFGRYIIIEFWDGSTLVSTRMLDCADLLEVPEGPGPQSILRYSIGFGFDWDAGKISLGVGVIGTTPGWPSASVFKEWLVPELVGFSNTPRSSLEASRDVLNIGGGLVTYNDPLDGGEGFRSAWGYVKPIQGRFTSKEYLTQGNLARLASKLEGDA